MTDDGNDNLNDNDDTKQTKTKVEPKVEPKSDMVTMSQSEFANIQKSMAELQTNYDGLKVEKEKIARDAVMVELTALNPALAKTNKDVDFAKLKIVLEVAKEMKTGIPDLKKGSKDEKPKNPLNIGSFDASKGQWNIE